MLLRRFYYDKLAQASYMVGCQATGEALVVDVRSQVAWKQGHVPGAEHAFFGELRRRAAELPRDKRVLLYCQRGKRSAVAAGVLQAEGFGDVRTVQAGITERIASGLPLVRG